MENNKNRFVIWLLIVIIILLVTLIGVLVIKTNDKEEVVDNKNSITTDVNETSKNEKEEIKVEEEKTNTATQTKVEIKEVEKYAFVKYDPTKSDLSNLKGTKVRLGSPAESAAISTDGTVSVIIVKDNYPKSFSVTNLNGKVLDAIGGPVGNGSTSRIYLLMEDGTVKYTEDLLSINENASEIKVEGKIDGVSNIVRICYLDNSKGGVPAAIDKDGKCHSLLK